MGKFRKLPAAFAALCALFGCAEEPPVTTVEDFLQNRILLDAAMARCSIDRDRTRYEADCVNAREASKRIALEEEAERQRVLEAQSERKRLALRRAQQAADDARRRAAEAEQARRDAEYQAMFEPADDAAPVITTTDSGASVGAATSAPGVTEPGSATSTGTAPVPTATEAAGQDGTVTPEPVDRDGAATADLETIREELKKRSEGS